eukprot:scaffold1202_cov384-Prasinococcus_capsulatus_cf.AAC.22
MNGAATSNGVVKIASSIAALNLPLPALLAAERAAARKGVPPAGAPAGSAAGPDKQARASSGGEQAGAQGGPRLGQVPWRRRHGPVRFRCTAPRRSSTLCTRPCHDACFREMAARHRSVATLYACCSVLNSASAASLRSGAARSGCARRARRRYASRISFRPAPSRSCSAARASAERILGGTGCEHTPRNSPRPSRRPCHAGPGRRLAPPVGAPHPQLLRSGPLGAASGGPCTWGRGGSGAHAGGPLATANVAGSTAGPPPGARRRRPERVVPDSGAAHRVRRASVRACVRARAAPRLPLR